LEIEATEGEAWQGGANASVCIEQDALGALECDFGRSGKDATQKTGVVEAAQAVARCGPDMADLEIAALSVGEGTLAIASLPGRGGDLKGDLALFGEFKPSLVLTMVTEAELEDIGAGQFGFEVQALGCRWAHLPVVDYGTPAAEALSRWGEVSEMARAALRGGGRVIVHCKGGCGRSGMAALRLMIEAGEAPDMALKRLRAVRPCAVETAEQLAWATVTVSVTPAAK